MWMETQSTAMTQSYNLLNIFYTLIDYDSF